MLIAWDPVAQKEVWRVPFGNRGRGGGTLATAGGLVFQGNSKFQEFAAYRADNGEKLWSMPVQTGIVAGPASFELDGEQYVAVTAGNNQSNYYSSNHSRLLVFKLGGDGECCRTAQPALPPPPFDPPKETPKRRRLVALGEAAYSRTCAGCHGVEGARNSGNFPDLRRSSGLKDGELLQVRRARRRSCRQWDEVVRGNPGRQGRRQHPRLSHLPVAGRAARSGAWPPGRRTARRSAGASTCAADAVGSGRRFSFPRVGRGAGVGLDAPT